MRQRLWTFTLVLAVLLCASSALGWAGESTVDAADWLLSQQLSSGGFPWTPGGSETTNTQGPSGNGLLAAAGHTGMVLYLDAALATGDYLVPVYTKYYADSDPRFSTYDPLFLEMLSQGTGDLTYSSFVQTYFWDYLAAGTYGESNDTDAVDFGLGVVTSRAGQGIVEISPWDIAGAAVGAQMAGEPAIAADLMQGVLAGLDATTTAGGYDVIGLAGAVWASGITGIDLDPTAGIYAAANSTADLAAILATMTLAGNNGAWLYDSTADPTDASYADTQTTAFALLAFQAFDPVTYADQIGRGVAFIRSLQYTDGQFLAYPTAAPNTSGSVEVQAESLLAIALTAPEDVVVDGNFTGMSLGDDPDGGDPLIAIGYDAFARINAGIDAVKLGGTVYVMGEHYYSTGLGDYNETVLIYKPVTLDGIAWPAVNPASGAAILLRSPGGVPLADVTITGIDSFTGSYGLLIDEAMWAHLSEELVVEDLAYDGASWLHDHALEGIAILHGATVNGIALHTVSLENNLNGLGISGAGTAVNGLVMTNDTLIYNRNHGMYVYSGPTLTNLSVSQSAFERNTHQGLHLQNATLDGAQITESSFSYNGGFGLWFQGADCSGLVIQDTLIEGNDGSGLALHSGLFSDVLIQRSTFRDNAWEHLDLGLWGGVAALDNVQILESVFDIGREGTAIYIDSGASFGAGDVQLHYNVFTLGDWAIGNSSTGVVDATLNWWGSSDGPVAGAPIWGNVIFSPWLGIDPDGQPGTVGVQLISPMLYV
ncbi:right-handed parallel beta-helix repeat-containing protein, partial [Candidatus Bipolaricaulota bacterium]|nr:right-handed parallel beta-helix repeat-containing protein [Candidatus Bipolaricaulota bacterium]